MEIPGRKEKLFELQKAWAVALSGRPRVVFVEGQDDPDKSALVDAFLEMIRGQQTTDKRPLVGRGRCFEIDGFSEPLRPAWDALCGMLDELGEEAAIARPARPARLSAVAELAAVVPDAHIARIGQTLADVLCDERGRVRIPRQHYLDAPDLVIRDAILTLTSEWPVAICLDGLELADAATLSALTDLLDILWEHDQPFYFLLVLTCEPEVGRSRHVLDRIEEILERYDRPKNRIITRVRLHPGEQDERAPSYAALDLDAHEILAAASLQGRRFSPATVASACGRADLEVLRVMRTCCEDGLVREVSGPAVLELFGRGVFEFVDPRTVDRLAQAMSPCERRFLHGRIADHLTRERVRIRDWRSRLQASSSEREGASSGDEKSVSLGDKFVRDAHKLDACLGALSRMLVRHLQGAGRAIDAACALRDVEEAFQRTDSSAAGLDKRLARGKFGRGERTRQGTWLAQIAEETLLSLVRLQPRAEPADIARASYDAACVAAERRLELGEEDAARLLFERALDHARWLGDDELECRILHHVTEPTKEIL